MPTHPLPARLEELEPKKVIACRETSDGGYDVMLECGHKSYWAVAPGETARCSECLDQAIEKLRKKEGFRMLDQGRTE